MLLKRLFNEILSEVVHHSKVKGQKLYTYDELSDEAKRVAREEVIRSFKFGYDDSLSASKKAFKSNMHAAINDKHHFGRVRYSKSLVDKMINNRAHLEGVIRENLMHFLEDGTYVTYSLDYGNRK